MFLTIEEARAYLKKYEDTCAFALLSAMAELRYKCCLGYCSSCDDAIVCAEMMKTVVVNRIGEFKDLS